METSDNTVSVNGQDDRPQGLVYEYVWTASVGVCEKSEMIRQTPSQITKLNNWSELETRCGSSAPCSQADFSPASSGYTLTPPVVSFPVVPFINKSLLGLTEPPAEPSSVESSCDMGQSPPPSPAPSDELYQTPMMNSSVNTSHPRDAIISDQNLLGYSQPQSRYTTPVPRDDFPTYEHCSIYSQTSPEYPFDSYPSGRDSSIAPYGSLPGEMGYVKRTPYTPEASPPMPYSTRSEAIKTRSGLSIPRTTSAPSKPLGVKSGRVQKKRKDPKVKTGPPIITKSLSEIAKDVPSIPVADIAAFVARPTELRQQETSRNKKPGSIKRPMNAFMLYRKAYQEVAKTQCAQNNHQHVSKVCGAGWPLESDEVHEMFTNWAKLERNNHQKAHPEYKFTPSKPKKGKRLDDIENDSAACSDAEDSDWASAHGMARGGARPRGARQVSRMSETPSINYERYASVDPMDVSHMQAQAYHAAYAYPTPGRPHPQPLPYGQMEVTQYTPLMYPHPNALGIMQDVISRTPSPGIDYQMNQMQHLESSPAYINNYYGAMESGMEPAFEQRVDPLLSLGAPYTLYDGITDSMPLPEDTWGPHLSGGQAPGLAMADFEEGNAHDDYLRGKEEDWKVEELDAVNHFDDWIIESETGC
ncbi:hypothetical protein G7046_g4578 [Stylonectria norvegica]|nr:hypothetical protein G7046_g4578 [Stylonectria norvegica]